MPGPPEFMLVLRLCDGGCGGLCVPVCFICALSAQHRRRLNDGSCALCVVDGVIYARFYTVATRARVNEIQIYYTQQRARNISVTERRREEIM